MPIPRKSGNRGKSGAIGGNARQMGKRKAGGQLPALRPMGLFAPCCVRRVLQRGQFRRDVRASARRAFGRQPVDYSFDLFDLPEAVALRRLKPPDEALLLVPLLAV